MTETGTEAPGAGTATSTHARDARPFTVVLAEDDDDHAALVRTALRAVPEVRMERVRDGRALLDRLRGPGAAGEVDLVLLDLKMSGMDGLAALRAMRKDADLEPVVTVVLTSSCSTEDREAAAQAGAADYLVKPVRLSDLRRDLAEVCARYRQ